MRLILTAILVLSVPGSALACGMEEAEPSIPLADLMEYVDELGDEAAARLADQVGLELPDQNRLRHEEAEASRKRGLLAFLHRPVVAD